MHYRCVCRVWFLMMLSACVAAVNCCPVLHRCVAIFFSGHQGSWIVCRLHFKTGFCSCTRASVVWHLSLPLMNIFNKTEAAILSCMLCFLGAFTFLNFNLRHTCCVMMTSSTKTPICRRKATLITDGFR